MIPKRCAWEIIEGANSGIVEVFEKLRIGRTRLAYNVGTKEGPIASASALSYQYHFL